MYLLLFFNGCCNIMGGYARFLTEPIHSSLSDVALYSLSGLVAVSLVQLFEDDCHRYTDIPFPKYKPLKCQEKNASENVVC